MANDSHIMFPITSELKSMFEIIAAKENMSLSALIKKTMIDAYEIDYEVENTSSRKKYANEAERKNAQKIRNNERKDLVKKLLAEHEASKKAK